jgi:hypothetical protein
MWTNHGHFSNEVRQVTGIVGGAFGFQGGSGVVVPDSPSLNFGPGADFSIEAWVKPLVAPTQFGVMAIVDKRLAPNLGQSQGYSLALREGQISFQMSDGLESGFLNWEFVGPDLRDGAWHHVAVSVQRASSAGMRLYVDGKLVLTADPSSHSGSLATTAPLLIGMHSSHDWFNGNFSGEIDEVSLYSRALAAGEIEAIHESGSLGKCGTPAPPRVFAQPAPLSVISGESATFTVAAGGTTPLSFQWRFNGTNIDGATNLALTLTNVQPAAAGNYSVLVTNLLGSALSSNALLTVIARPTSCVEAPAGLAGWWAGDGTATDLVGKQDGIPQEGVTFGEGVVGLGFNFDGATGRVMVPDAPALNFGSGVDFSIEAWVRPFPHISTMGLMAILDKRDLTGPFAPVGYTLFLQDGRLGCQLAQRSPANLQSFVAPGPNIQDGMFHHVALTVQRQTADGGKLYVDGKVVLTFDPASVSGDLSNTAPLRLGQHADASLSSFFKGTIDEVSVYRRTLAAEEVQTLFLADLHGKCKPPQPPVITTQPAGQLAFVGNTVYLAVGAGGTPPLSYQWTFQGTNLPGATNASLILTNVQLTHSGNYAVIVTNAVGSATSFFAQLTVTLPAPCVQPPAGLVSWWRAEGDTSDRVGDNDGPSLGAPGFAPGLVGQAFWIDGRQGEITIGNPPSLQLQDFTIEAWIKRSSSLAVTLGGGSAGFIFGYGMSGYGLYLDAEGRPTLTHVGQQSVNAGFAIKDTSFHHLAVTKAGGKVVFYLDGTASFAAPFDAVFTFSASAAIGGLGDNPGNTFLGLIDELSIYNRALSTTEIQGLFNANGGGKCDVPVAPFFVTEPAGQTVLAGNTVVLQAAAGGTAPFAYQWRFNGVEIPGATNATLALDRIQRPQAGAYSVRVTNVAGAATSGNAVLTVQLPPALVRIASTNVTAGSIVHLPVYLVANGDENSLSFSVNFDPNRLALAGVVPGDGAAGALLLQNKSMTGNGRVGISILWPPGRSFSAGTQQVAVISLAAQVFRGLASVPLGFGDLPVARSLLDDQLRSLPANFASGSITVAGVAGLEGDVFPRSPSDLAISAADWQLLGRYVARLEAPATPGEFQRADCAPRLAAGDGLLSVTDWVQEGRFAAGLDPLAPVGGPDRELRPSLPLESDNRFISVHGVAELSPGESGESSVVLSARGDENAVAFSLVLDPAMTVLDGVSPGVDARGNFAHVNTNDLPVGRVGFVVALNPGAALQPGPRELLRIRYTASTTASGAAPFRFVNEPVIGQVSDAAANPLPVTFVTNALVVRPSATLRIRREADARVRLSWPLSATNLVLQQIVGALPPAGGWTNVPASPTITNDERTVILPIEAETRFFRLARP